MTDLQTMPAEVDVEPDVDTEPGDPTNPHIGKNARGENAAASVLAARITGTPLVGLSGFGWGPAREPETLPMWGECQSIDGVYKAFNDGLRDTPNE